MGKKYIVTSTYKEVQYIEAKNEDEALFNAGASSDVDTSVLGLDQVDCDIKEVDEFPSE